GATEDRGYGASDDRGDQAGLGSHPGGNTECQRQRQRHDRDGKTRNEILPPRFSRWTPVVQSRQECEEVSHRGFSLSPAVSRGFGREFMNRWPDAQSLQHLWLQTALLTG